MEMFAVVIVYVGLAAMFVGAASVVKPLRFLHLRTRKAGLLLFVCGAAVFLLGESLPAGATRAAARQSRIDEWMPEWQFSEFHSLRVRATPEQAYRAIREVTAGEIFLFRTLTWIRNPHLPGRGPENILNAPGEKPILDVATAGGFKLLVEEAPREILLGTVVLREHGAKPAVSASPATRVAAEKADASPPAAVRSEPDATERGRDFIRAALSQPGFAVATINFAVRDDGGGWCTVTTETRVFATSDSARRSFAAYWRVIYPGSSLLRYTWLRAIQRRAEAGR